MGLVPEVMLAPSTLKNWQEMGYGYDTFGYSRMVILDVDSREGYLQGHIPGAFLLEEGPVDLWATRTNGITESPFQVATKKQMDDIIHRTTIDSDAVVVITGDSMTGMARAYFNFRHWGFPRHQLKVLNGTKSTYAAAGYALQTEAPPVPEPCTYSVCKTTGTEAEAAVRASFEEMLAAAVDDYPETLIIDGRSPEEYAGTPGSTPIDENRNGFAVFEGHMRTAVNIDYRSLLIGGLNENQLLPKQALLEMLNKKNIGHDAYHFVYGRNAHDDALLFLVLDGALHWQVKLYDGGWSQWGRMAENSPEKGGGLEADSPWRTDKEERSESITYNRYYDFPVFPGGPYNSYAKHGNLINRGDSEACGKTAETIKSSPPAPGY